MDNWRIEEQDDWFYPAKYDWVLIPFFKVWRRCRCPWDGTIVSFESKDEANDYIHTKIKGPTIIIHAVS